MKAVPWILLALVLVPLAFWGVGSWLRGPSDDVPTSLASDSVGFLRGLPFEVFLDASFREALLLDPETVTFLGLSESFGMRDDELTDISQAGIEKRLAFDRAILELLRTYDRDALGEPEATWYDAYAWFLEDRIEGYAYERHAYPLHGFFGYSIPSGMNILFSWVQPLTSRENLEDYLSRLAQIPARMSDVLDTLAFQESIGLHTPRYMLEGCLGQIDSALGIGEEKPTSISEVPVESISAFKRFDRDLAAIDGLTESERNTARQNALAGFRDGFLAGYWTIREAILERMPSAPEEGGAATFADGQAYYAYQLHRKTSVDVSPAELHKLGLDLVDDLLVKIRSGFAELGYDTELSIGELWKQAEATDTLYDPSDPEQADALVAKFREILDETTSLITPHFGRLPANELEIRLGGPGTYTNSYDRPSWDGSRPGVFNVASMGPTPESQMLCVLHHEGVPGHHLQLSLAQELNVPLFMRILETDGFVEGWALYCEQLGYELGLYEGRPLANLYRLDLELLRAARLVVDTGIHAFGWTREQASSYLESLRGFPPGALLGSIERYVVLPGQACSYMVGKLTLESLRSKAEAALGDAFSLQVFHDVILGSGGIPLDVVVRQVDLYIEANRTP